MITRSLTVRSGFLTGALIATGVVISGCDSGDHNPDGAGSGGSSPDAGAGSLTKSGNGGGGSAAVGGTGAGIAGGVAAGGAAMSGAGGSMGGGGTGGGGAGGSGEYDPSKAGICMLGIQTTSSGSDHTHDLVIYPNTFIEGIDAIYATTEDGVDKHDHFIQTTAADIVRLQAGDEVRKKTCSGSDHEFILKCTHPASPPSLPNDCTNECGSSPTDLCP